MPWRALVRVTAELESEEGERGEGKDSRRDVHEMVLMSISESIVQGV